MFTRGFGICDDVPACHASIRLSAFLSFSRGPKPYASVAASLSYCVVVVVASVAASLSYCLKVGLISDRAPLVATSGYWKRLAAVALTVIPVLVVVMIIIMILNELNAKIV